MRTQLRELHRVCWMPLNTHPRNTQVHSSVLRQRGPESQRGQAAAAGRVARVRSRAVACRTALVRCGLQGERWCAVSMPALAQTCGSLHTRRHRARMSFGCTGAPAASRAPSALGNPPAQCAIVLAAAAAAAPVGGWRKAWGGGGGARCALPGERSRARCRRPPPPITLGSAPRRARYAPPLRAPQTAGIWQCQTIGTLPLVPPCPTPLLARHCRRGAPHALVVPAAPPGTCAPTAPRLGGPGQRA